MSGRNVLLAGADEALQAHQSGAIGQPGHRRAPHKLLLGLILIVQTHLQVMKRHHALPATPL